MKYLSIINKLKKLRTQNLNSIMPIIIKHLKWLHEDLGDMIRRLELGRLEVQYIPKFWMDYVRESIENNPEIHSEGE